MSGNHSVIHWFRKGLRLHDNPALIEAVNEAKRSNCVLRPIFILDTRIAQYLKIGNNRWRFLIQTLEDLDANLKKINSKLYVLRGSPDEVFPDLFAKWNVKLLTFEYDTEPYSQMRDKQVEKLAEKANVKIIQKISHTVYDVRTVIARNKGSAPLTYQKFLSVIDGIPVPKVEETCPDIPLECRPHQEDDNSYNCPSYSELNIDEKELYPCLFPGGETEALKRMEKCLAKKQWICKFEKPQTSPNSLEPSTTVLSPYLKFGCLSSRLLLMELKRVIGSSPHTKPPVSLIGQLMWREFYYAAGFSTPNFDKMIGNPICHQIPWREDEDKFNAWKNGMTGYPFIDAIMRQLKQEGWIHHLARHAVACFLTRGDLWISWERGKDVFEEYLLDADWALNAGNWMWLSASAFFHQFFRVYSPVAFGKKTDKSGTYIKKYVPELKKFPPNFIYEPWLAPKTFQKSVGCIIGKDYPERIVIHENVYKENISKMSIAYKAKASTNLGKRPNTSK